MKQEILMLLAKIRYAVGDHQGALDRLEELNLDSLPLGDISSRKMKLIGECFAIKGPFFNSTSYIFRIQFIQKQFSWIWPPALLCLLPAGKPKTTVQVKYIDIAVRSLTCHTATGTHMPYRITQCYLPPDRGDIPAFIPAEAGTRLSEPEICKAELT